MLVSGICINDMVVNEIGKFAILWNEFEKIFTQYGNNYDFLSLCERITFEMKACDELRLYLLAQKNYTSQETEKFVNSFLFTTNAIPPKEQKIKNIVYFLDNKGTTEEKMCGCLHTIKRYRDNLMHGIKDLSGLNDQLIVFKTINEILEYIIVNN